MATWRRLALSVVTLSAITQTSANDITVWSNAQRKLRGLVQLENPGRQPVLATEAYADIAERSLPISKAVANLNIQSYAENQTALPVYSTTTHDANFCALSKCSFLGFGSCDSLASAEINLHYVYRTSFSCKLLGQQQMCCAQTCKADIECPLQHYCQSFNSGQKYCYRCQDCPA